MNKTKSLDPRSFVDLRFYEDDDNNEEESNLIGSNYDKASFLTDYQNSTAKDFLDQVTYSVPTKGLYKVKMQRTGYRGSKYQAVLLEIVDEKLKQLYDNSTHLLQVWNNSGDMVYQRKIVYGDG